RTSEIKVWISFIESDALKKRKSSGGSRRSHGALCAGFRHPFDPDIVQHIRRQTVVMLDHATANLAVQNGVAVFERIVVLAVPLQNTVMLSDHVGEPVRNRAGHLDLH